MIYKKVVVAGQVGSGKTALIRTLSDIEAFETDVKSSIDIGKELTTIGIDYGRVQLDKDTAIGLYGVPGQERYSFLWEQTRQSAWGMIFLVDLRESSELTYLDKLIEFFKPTESKVPCVVGLTHCDLVPDNRRLAVSSMVEALLDKYHIQAPIINIDPRNLEQSSGLLHVINSIKNYST